MPATIHVTIAGKSSETTRPHTLALMAFAAVALFGGANAVAIKMGLAELVPFWSAAIRFIGAAIALFVVVAAMRLSLPSGRALVGVILYGILAFGLSYFFGYWALQEVSAGTAMMILATVPLLTSILAIAQRVNCPAT